MGKLSRLSNTYLPFVNATICLSAHFPEWLVTVDWVSLFPLRCRNYVPIADSNPIINSWWISIPMIHGIHGLTVSTSNPLLPLEPQPHPKPFWGHQQLGGLKVWPSGKVCSWDYDTHLFQIWAQGNGGSRPNTPSRLETPELPGNTGVWGALWRLCSLFFPVKHYSYIYICIDNDIVEC